MTDEQVYATSAVLGATAGMRSMASPALLSQFAKSGLLPIESSPLGFLGRPRTVKTLALLAAGELIADKLPFLPKRTRTPALFGRAFTGGFSGGALALSQKRSVLAGALCGIAGAMGAAFAAYELRRWAGKKLELPDPVVAIVEDALVAGCAVLVLSALKAKQEPASRASRA